MAYFLVLFSLSCFTASVQAVNGSLECYECSSKGGQQKCPLEGYKKEVKEFERKTKDGCIACSIQHWSHRVGGGKSTSRVDRQCELDQERLNDAVTGKPLQGCETYAEKGKGKGKFCVCKQSLCNADPMHAQTTSKPKTGRNAAERLQMSWSSVLLITCLMLARSEIGTI